MRRIYPKIKGGNKVTKTIKARYSKGVIEPLEKVDIPEGRELIVTVVEVPSECREDALEKSAGAWKGTIDADKLIEDVYADRLVSTRGKPEL
jgi:predicted DNA-binding antitoxin AbrB/MazE fold protein